MAVLGFLLVLAVVLGHGALSVYLFNRINATSIPRVTLKKFEKLILAYFAIVPVILLITDGFTILRMLADVAAYNDLTIAAKLFTILNCISLAMLLPLWIVGRVEYWRQQRYVSQIKSEYIDVAAKLGDELFKRRWLQSLSRFPGNEIHVIEVSTKQLPIKTLPRCWNGLRIAHLSDLHLTGWYDERFYIEAMSAIMALKPDLCVIAGDLVDRQECVDVMKSFLSDCKCPLGNFFILGNHDTRILAPDAIRTQLAELGWIDLGQTCHQYIDNSRHGCLEVLGNERPWFDLPDRNISEREIFAQNTQSNLLRIGVCHTPDQWPWAMRAGCQLTLCGHTHGGQVRVPVIGPIIAPSWHGSRYASGIFERSGHVMHVSRGLAGTQPLRLGCKPEVSLLVLQAS